MTDKALPDLSLTEPTSPNSLVHGYKFFTIPPVMKWSLIPVLLNLDWPQGQEDLLEREWQPTPVLLSGESLWTEEPSGLQSMGSQRVGHD